MSKAEDIVKQIERELPFPIGMAICNRIAVLLEPHLVGEWSKAVLDILAERKKQVAKGYTPEHDDEHDMGELGLAAALDALPYDANIGGQPLLNQDDYIGLHIALETGLDFYLQPIENVRDRLIRAAALLVAEIERIDRLPVAPPKGEQSA